MRVERHENHAATFTNDFPRLNRAIPANSF